MQHRMLISYINRLGELAKNDQPNPAERELFLRFLDFLENYIFTHFKDEEGCMHRARCPVCHANVRAHAEFLDFFREFKERLGSSHDVPALTRELHDSCCSWIRQHILRIDVQLKATLEQAEALDLSGQFPAN